MGNQEKLLEVLLELGGDVEPIGTKEIKAAWPDCPPVLKMMNLGNGTLFETIKLGRNPDMWGLQLTPEGISRASEAKKELEKERREYAEKAADRAADRAFQIKLAIMSGVISLIVSVVINLLFH